MRAPGIIPKILPLILMKGSANFGLWGNAGGKLGLGLPLSCFSRAQNFGFVRILSAGAIRGFAFSGSTNGMALRSP